MLGNRRAFVFNFKPKRKLMDINIDSNSLALFITVLITMLTLIGKQWHADRKTFRILNTMEQRQEGFSKTVETFQQTLDTIQVFIAENSKEHAIMLERLKNGNQK